MFLSRLYSSIVILVIFFSIVIIRGPVGLTIFLLVGLFISAVAVRELSLILCNFGIEKYLYANEIFSCLVFIGFVLYNIFEINSYIIVLLIVIVLLIIALWLKILFSINKKDEIPKILNLICTSVLLIIPLNFITIIFMQGYGIDYVGLKLIIYMILVTKFGDVGAYVTGMLLSKRENGNHQIAPIISPKKSWEGTIGGLITSVVVSIIVCEIYAFAFSIIAAIILGIFLFIGGFIGDLSESSLKRCANIKDSGSVIPGIGGVLDLVDSLLINAPLFFLLLLFFGVF